MKMVFKGSHGTSINEQLDFILASSLMCIAITMTLRISGFIGNRVIILGKVLAHEEVMKLIVILYLIGLLYVLFFVGIEEDDTCKMLGLAFFPSFILMIHSFCLIFQWTLIARMGMMILALYFLGGFSLILYPKYQQRFFKEKIYLDILYLFFHVWLPLAIVVFTIIGSMILRFVPRFHLFLTEISLKTS